MTPDIAKFNFTLANCPTEKQPKPLQNLLRTLLLPTWKSVEPKTSHWWNCNLVWYSGHPKSRKEQGYSLVSVWNRRRQILPSRAAWLVVASSASRPSPPTTALQSLESL